MSIADPVINDLKDCLILQDGSREVPKELFDNTLMVLEVQNKLINRANDLMKAFEESIQENKDVQPE